MDDRRRKPRPDRGDPGSATCCSRLGLEPPERGRGHAGRRAPAGGALPRRGPRPRRQPPAAREPLPGGGRLKTPKNSLRVPFLAQAFPDAFFLYLYRDPRETISSMLDAWTSGRFVTFPGLPGWKDLPWSLLLVPGWRDLEGQSLAEIVTRQWITATEILLDDLEALPPGRWCVAGYDQLIADPQAEIARLCDFAGLAWDRELSAPLPLSRHTLTSPAPEKWRHNAPELEPVIARVTPVAERARAIFARPPARRPDRRSPAQGPRPVVPAVSAPVSTGNPEAFRSVYTASVPSLLREIGASLLVSTYQSGRLIGRDEQRGAELA